MKNISKLLAGLGVVGVLGVSSMALANRGDGQMGANYSPERHEMMEKAFESNDYDAWYALMTQDGRQPKVLEFINKDNFSKFAEMHLEMEKARQIAEELGLPQAKMGRGMGMGRGHGPEDGRPGGNVDPAVKEQIQAAVTNNDYDTWYALMTQDGRQPKMLEVINKDNFGKLKEIHDARAAGDFEKAREISDELGLKGPRGGKGGSGGMLQDGAQGGANGGQ